MKRKHLAITACGLLVSSLLPNSDIHAGRSDGNAIPKAAIEEMFARSLKKAAWRIDGVCLWGYFFTDQSREKLKKAEAALAAMGYRQVDIFRPAGRDFYFLHVERVEQHSIDSLHARNTELSEFAIRYELRSYDGMDVGPLKDGQCG